MKRLIGPPLHLVRNVNRMDPTEAVVPTITDNYMNQMEDFPKDFFPMMAKKYSPSHIFKHVYVTSPSKIVVNKKKMKKKESKEESWLESFNPFGCESDYDNYDED